MINYNLMTPIHAAAKNGDLERLYYFISSKLNQNDPTMRLLNYTASKEKKLEYVFLLRLNSVVNL